MKHENVEQPGSRIIDLDDLDREPLGRRRGGLDLRALVPEGRVNPTSYRASGTRPKALWNRRNGPAFPTIIRRPVWEGHWEPIRNR